MLAVFEKSVAKCPEGLKNAESKGIDALKDDVLLNHFSSVYPAGTVSINLGGSGIIAFSSQKQNPLLPRFWANGTNRRMREKKLKKKMRFWDHKYKIKKVLQVICLQWGMPTSLYSAS